MYLINKHQQTKQNDIEITYMNKSRPYLKWPKKIDLQKEKISIGSC
jgi:hypothetical protein